MYSGILNFLFLKKNNFFFYFLSNDSGCQCKSVESLVSGVEELLSAASTKAEDKFPVNLLTVCVVTSYMNISFSIFS